MKTKVQFVTKAYIEDLGMWSLVKNISIFLAPNCDDIFVLDDIDNSDMLVNVELIDKIEELKKDEDEFYADDLEFLKNLLIETKNNGCSTLEVRS